MSWLVTIFADVLPAEDRTFTLLMTACHRRGSSGKIVLFSQDRISLDAQPPELVLLAFIRCPAFIRPTMPQKDSVKVLLSLARV